MTKAPAVGTQAPDFTLTGVALDGDGARRGDYSTVRQRGSPLVLVFYPGDDTSVCSKQLCSYTSDLERFTGLGATVWGISPQGLDSHEAFARKYDLRMPLLADTGREVARSFGVAAAGIGVRRAVFLIAPDSTVHWKHVAVLGVTFQSLRTLSKHLAAMPA